MKRHAMSMKSKHMSLGEYTRKQIQENKVLMNEGEGKVGQVYYYRESGVTCLHV